MPEGHTTHRLAAEHSELLGRRRVRVSSPQGRFAAGAELLDGTTLRRVDAYGKHLLYTWSQGRILHVHLGLYGAFKTWNGTIGDPSPNARLRMAHPRATIDLAGPTACELIGPDEADRLLARLGPDPLRSDADPEIALAGMRRSRRPIGAVLLDQRVLAGVGNVFRAEALFLEHIHPERPSSSLAPDQLAGLWWRLGQLLADGVEQGRIVTVPQSWMPADEPRGPGWGRWVYRRTGQPCRVCATPVRAWELAARTMYACPSCQPPGDTPDP